MGKSSNKALNISKPTQVMASTEQDQAYLANVKKVMPIKITG